jgi:hypothetical protein
MNLIYSNSIVDMNNPEMLVRWMKNYFEKKLLAIDVIFISKC